MPAPLSRDLRTRVVQAIDNGATTRAIAERFAVAQRTVSRYRRQYQDTGAIEPQPNRGRPARLVTESERLVQHLAERPTATLAEQCRYWTAQTGQAVSVTTMWRAIRAVGWTRKKGQWQPGNGTSLCGLPGRNRQHPEQ